MKQQSETNHLLTEEEQLNNLINKRNQLEEEIDLFTQKKEQLEKEMAQKLAETEEKISIWWDSKQEELEALNKKVREEANKEGFQQGYHDGFQQALSELKHKFEEAESTLQHAYTEKERIIQEAEPFLLSLSVKIAEKIIKQELTTSEDGLLHIIREELAQIRDRGEITLQVPIDEYQKLLPYREELQSFVPAEIELKIVPDSHIAQLDCLIQTPSGSYDLTINSQLEEVKKQLLTFYEERVAHAT